MDGGEEIIHTTARVAGRLLYARYNNAPNNGRMAVISMQTCIRARISPPSSSLTRMVGCCGIAQAPTSRFNCIPPLLRSVLRAPAGSSQTTISLPPIALRHSYCPCRGRIQSTEIPEKGQGFQGTSDPKAHPAVEWLRLATAELRRLDWINNTAISCAPLGLIFEASALRTRLVVLQQA